MEPAVVPQFSAVHTVAELYVGYLPGPEACDRRPLEHRSVLEVEALPDLVPASGTIALRAQCVRHVIARHDHVVELPDRAVLPHPWDGVVDVELPADSVGGDEPVLSVQTSRIDDLIFLRHLDLLRVDLEVALFGGEDNVAVEPDAFDLVAVRIVVVKIFDRADSPSRFLRPRFSAMDLPHALGRFCLFRHAQEPTPLAAELRS